MKKDWIVVGPTRTKKKLVLAHGAGAPMDSPFMNDICELLSKKKIQTIRFEFPYMAGRRKTGQKRPPDRGSVLERIWLEVIEQIGADGLFIGGKSMGGRIASMIADQAKVKGLVCLGYPFHAPGKTKKSDARIDHLLKMKTRALVIQGDRDSMGSKKEVPSYKLPRKIKLHWLADGDHSFKPRKSSGFTLESHLEKSAEVISKFMT